MAPDMPEEQNIVDEIASLTQVLKSKQERLGEEHDETLNVMDNLAFLLTRRRDFEAAEELLRRAVTILDRRSGREHLQNMHSLKALSIVLNSQGKLEEAETVLWQVLDLNEHLIGKEHPETLRCRETLAWTLHGQGRYEKARELYPQRRLGDPGTIVMFMDDTSRLDEAEKIHRGSTEMRAKLLGSEHPDTLTSLSKLAGFLKGRCKRTEAEQIYRKLVEVKTRQLGRDHEDTFEIRKNLAEVLSDEKNYHDAENVLRELVESQQRVLGEKHLKVLISLSALAMVLKELERLNEAEGILRQLVIKSSIHGENYTQRLEWMNELAIVVSEQEKYAEAESILQQLTELQKETLGRDHPKTLTSLSYFAIALEKQGKHDEAEAALQLWASSSMGETNKVENTDKQNEFFQYNPLKSTISTRILKLHPSRYKTAALICELAEEVLDSNNPPSYAAISYCWGSQIPSKQIFCHGRKFLVTENCEAILRQFRQPEKMSYLWIDAISIDQTSVQERSQQVGIMEDIYRLAEVVVVWLGSPTEFTTEAFGYLADVAQGGSNSEGHIPRPNEVVETIPVDDKRASPQVLVGDVLRRPWFSRMWTIQEVAMSSPQAAVLCCGSEMISWSVFMKALGSSRGVPDVGSLVQKSIQIFYRLDTLFQAVRASSRRPGSVPPQWLLRSHTPLAGILNILVETRGKASTDARDKVFALHGMLKAFDANFPAPDYSKPASQVFCDTARAVITHDKKLHILYHVSSRSRMSDLPSWVPDWSDTNVTANSPAFQFCEASRSSRTDWTFPDSVEGATLQIRGKVIDTVSTRTKGLSETFKASENEMEVFKDWVQCCNLITDSYTTGESIETAFYRTVVQVPPTDDGLCIPLSSSFRQKTSPEAFASWFKAITNDTTSDAAAQVISCTSSGISGPSNSQASIATSTTPVLDDTAKTFDETIREWLCGQALFLTEKQFVGIGGNMIEIGDVVALLAGLEMPMILRPSGDGYRVVAWAYIYGMMNGEAWPGVDNLDLITLV